MIGDQLVRDRNKLAAAWLRQGRPGAQPLGLPLPWAIAEALRHACRSALQPERLAPGPALQPPALRG